MLNVKQVGERLYVSAMPTKASHFDAIAARGITHVVSLEQRVDVTGFSQRGIVVFERFAPDHTPLRVPFLAEVADTIHQELTAGHCLLIHDRGGRTRSCTAVAAYYVKLGWQPKKALRKAAKVVPSFRESIKAYQLDRKIQQLFEHYYPEATPPEGFLTRFLNKLRFG